MSGHMPRRPEPEAMDSPAEAEAYARADFADVNQAFVARLLELAEAEQPRPRPEALDLGTGPADIPIRLLKARPEWRVVAVDASPPMLEFARRAVAEAGLSGSIELVQADAKATGLPAGRFDVVLSNSILHHVSDTQRLWSEVQRLARPGALVFFRDLARPPTLAAARRIVARYAAGEPPLLQEEYHRSLLSGYTVGEVRRQLARAGLGNLEVIMATDRHLDVFGRTP